LLDRNEQMFSLINATSDIIYLKDGEGRWLLANKAGLQLFALEGIDYIGKTDAQLAEHSRFYRDAFLTCEKTDEIAWNRRTLSREQEKVPQPSGQTKVYDTIKVPLYHPDGRRKGLVIIGRDVTEDIQAREELRRKNKKRVCKEFCVNGLFFIFNKSAFCRQTQWRSGSRRLSSP
jgi:PAS domain S-box-containing protein